VSLQDADDLAWLEQESVNLKSEKVMKQRLPEAVERVPRPLKSPAGNRRHQRPLRQAEMEDVMLSTAVGMSLRQAEPPPYIRFDGRLSS
jgi:hypothetical protein